MAHVSYPPAFPTECVSELISIARHGLDELTARKAEVGVHVWNIQGFGQSVFLGNPDGPLHATAPEDQSEAEESLQQLATDFAACSPNEITAADLAEIRTPVAIGAAAGFPQIDWDKWLKFFKNKVLPILNAL